MFNNLLLQAFIEVLPLPLIGTVWNLLTWSSVTSPAILKDFDVSDDGTVIAQVFDIDGTNSFYEIRITNGTGIAEYNYYLVGPGYAWDGSIPKVVVSGDGTKVIFGYYGGTGTAGIMVYTVGSITVGTWLPATNTWESTTSIDCSTDGSVISMFGVDGSIPIVFSTDDSGATTHETVLTQVGAYPAIQNDSNGSNTCVGGSTIYHGRDQRSGYSGGDSICKMYKSNNGGSTRTLVDQFTNLNSSGSTQVWCSKDGSTLVYGNIYKGFKRSIDGGITWLGFDATGLGYNIGDLAISNDGTIMYKSSYNGLGNIIFYILINGTNQSLGVDGSFITPDSTSGKVVCSSDGLTGWYMTSTGIFNSLPL